MTSGAQRIAITEACPTVIRCRFEDSWEWFDGFNWQHCFNNDPLQDLNAMHEAEKVLKFSQRQKYQETLRQVISMSLITSGELVHWRNLAHATAAQRAEAFLRTLGLWKD